MKLPNSISPAFLEWLDRGGHKIELKKNVLIVKQEKQIEKVVEKTPEKIVEQATENIEKMNVAEQNETSKKQQSSIQENSNNEKNKNLIVTGKQIGRAHV